jgi:hypothetical protein
MTQVQWKTEYDRLTKGFGRKPDIGQMDTYFDILGEYGIASVEGAVTKALAESKFFPKVAELVGGVHAYRRDHQAPATLCTVYAGPTFTILHCDGKQLAGAPGDDPRPLVPVNPFAEYVCHRDYAHPAHEDARRDPIHDEARF